MKEIFKKVSIDNDFFGSVVLDIFDKDKERVSVIYGANGTGKTTIGRAFSFIKNPIEVFDFINNSSILDESNGPIILSDEEKQKIYVFNEDFIDKEVSFRSFDKMKSIVMFGKNIENEAKISELNKKIENDKKAVCDLKLERYDDKKDSLSHLMYYDQIKKEASQDWAVEEQIILERQSKPPVSEEVMKKILEYNFAQKFDLNEYETKKTSFQKIGGKNPQPINDRVAKNLNLNLDFVNIIELLREEHNKPIGSDIVNRISKTLTEKSLNRLQEIKGSFNDGYCPYCFRDIGKDYVKHIIDEINKLQSDEIRNHIEKLAESRISLLNSDFSLYDILDKDLTSKITLQTQLINEYIEELDKKIDMKIDNPYDSITVSSLDAFNLTDLYKNIDVLEKLRLNFNQNINDKTKLKIELQKLNLERFSSSIKLLASNYHKQLKERDTKLSQKVKLEKLIEMNISEVKKLGAESKNIGIALKLINEYLSLIFLSKTRLYLEESDGAYLVKRGSNTIPLKKLSNGERNAISLCYFFTRMNENQSEENMFNAASLVILDDPLSSFDHNNKLGIYAFLRRMLSEILKISQSKILLLTHQIETFYDLQRIVSDIDKKYIRTSTLIDKKLNCIESSKFNLYKDSLNEIYKAITKTAPLTDDEVESLGNKLRKVTEAYSSFIYGCGIDKLSTDPTITDSIKPEKLRNYFIDSMYRISLNSASHLLERTKSIFDLLNIGYFDRDGLLRSLKDTLSLMYILNPKHICKMLDLTDETFFKNYLSEVISTE